MRLVFLSLCLLAIAGCIPETITTIYIPDPPPPGTTQVIIIHRPWAECPTYYCPIPDALRYETPY